MRAEGGYLILDGGISSIISRRKWNTLQCKCNVIEAKRYQRGLIVLHCGLHDIHTPSAIKNMGKEAEYGSCHRNDSPHITSERLHRHFHQHLRAWAVDGAEHTDTPATACLVPGHANICSGFGRSISHPDTNKAPLWAAFRSLVNFEGELFGNWLDDAFDGATFLLDIASRDKDLRKLVRFSELNDRENFADSLAEFLICARNLRKSLVRFYSGVKDTLDR
jgi:hypothetical protein